MAYPVSDAFRAALASSSHRPVVKFEVYKGNEVLATTGAVAMGSKLQQLKGSSGQVVSERHGDVRRSYSLDLVDPTGVLVPLIDGDLLDVRARHELQIWRGLRLRDPMTGAERDELVPLIRGSIEEVDLSEGSEGVQVAIAGRDRAASIAGYPWTTPYVIEAGTPVELAIAGVVLNRLPHLSWTIVLPSTGALVPARLVFGETGKANNPLRDLEGLALAAGSEFAFDAEGRPHLRAIPNPMAGGNAGRYVPGPGGLLVGNVSRRASVGQVYNGVRVRVESPDLPAPIYVEEWNTDPKSLTHYNPASPATSRWGQRPFDVSTNVSTEADARQVALAKLPDVLGYDETVSFSALVNPAQEVGDVVELGSRVVGTTGNYALERATMPIEPTGLMALTVVRKRF